MLLPHFLALARMYFPFTKPKLHTYNKGGSGRCEQTVHWRQRASASHTSPAFIFLSSRFASPLFGYMFMENAPLKRGSHKLALEGTWQTSLWPLFNFTTPNLHTLTVVRQMNKMWSLGLLRLRYTLAESTAKVVAVLITSQSQQRTVNLHMGLPVIPFRDMASVLVP